VKQDLAFVWKRPNNGHCRGVAVAKKQLPVAGAGGQANSTELISTVSVQTAARKQQVRQHEEKSARAPLQEDYQRNS
jgi:hypothetical protein